MEWRIQNWILKVDYLKDKSKNISSTRLFDYFRKEEQLKVKVLSHSVLGMHSLELLGKHLCTTKKVTTENDNVDLLFSLEDRGISNFKRLLHKFLVFFFSPVKLYLVTSNKMFPCQENIPPKWIKPSRKNK